MDYLEQVKRIQKERGLNDTQVAELLGYHNRTGWAKIKGGLVPANRSFTARAIAAFPELVLTLAGTSQDGKSGGLKRFLEELVLRVKKVI